MSKCRPEPTGGGGKLLEKGVILEEALQKTKNGKIVPKEEEVRYVVLRIPYELLKNDPETQIAFKDIVHISITE